MYVCILYVLYVWMDGCMDGWMDGNHGWIDGYHDFPSIPSRPTCHLSISCLFACTHAFLLVRFYPMSTSRGK